MAVTYILFGFGVTVGYHRLLTHRGFQTYHGLQYMWAVLGGMGLQGSVLDWVADHRKHHAHTDQEGDPHSPHVGHGHGVEGPLARAHRLAVRDARPGRLEEVRRRALRGPGHAPHQQGVPVDRVPEPRDPDGARLRAARLHARGRAARPRLGRPRARVLPAPRDVVDQLGLPLLRPPPVRHRGPLDERVLARAALVRRGVAPQPPRVPALGRARPRPLGGRPVGAADPRDEEGRPRLERDRDRARAPGGEADRRQPAARRPPRRRPQPEREPAGVS